MTRAAPYGSAAWRLWKHDHHWASGGAVVDPLGAGNTNLIAALGVTPIFFYDVRKNLTTSGANVSSLLDVKGDGTYGPSLTPPGTAPTWDGTTITTTGGTLLSSSTITGLDPSTQLTVVCVADVGGAAGKVGAQIAAAAAGAPSWNLPLVATGSFFRTQTSSNATGVTSTAATGTGNIRLAIYTVNVSGTDVVTVEVPNVAKATSASGAALASGNRLLALGGTTANAAEATVRWRAILAWAGGYTSGQAATLATWATTFHSAVLA